jgi:hypothetical protein
MFSMTDGGTIQQTIGYLLKIKSQIPYATALGLNNLAIEAQTNTTENLLKQKFRIRTPWYRRGTKYGFNVKFAKKDDQEARMGTAADWMKLQEEGGTKTAKSGGSVALPTSGSEGIRENPMDILTQEKRPRGILAGENGFFIKTKKGWMLAERTSEDINQNGVRFGGLKFAYLFKKSAQIKAKFDFVPTETALVQRRYQPVMEAALARAIETAR